MPYFSYTLYVYTSGLQSSKDVYMRMFCYQVLGQVDNKFIAALVKPTGEVNNFLVLFDQHAVDERIRLEALIAGENLIITFKLVYANRLYFIQRSRPILPVSEFYCRIMIKFGSTKCDKLLC